MSTAAKWTIGIVSTVIFLVLLVSINLFMFNLQDNPKQTAPYVDTQGSDEDAFIEHYDERVIENGKSQFTSDVQGRAVLLDTAEAVCTVFDNQGVNDESINFIITTAESNGLPAEAWAPLVTASTAYICPEHDNSLRTWMNG